MVEDIHITRLLLQPMFIRRITIQPTITTQCITTQSIQHIHHIIAIRTTTTTTIRTHAITNISIKKETTISL
ncbi:hypothetical protein [Lysinibacillus xylanilyticus]|uniref:hypothetical protein n=1 Tax=Lysinibacillus xylanilyticus TaxID=582475 RepID=UPI003D0480A2